MFCNVDHDPAPTRQINKRNKKHCEYSSYTVFHSTKDIFFPLLAGYGKNVIMAVLPKVFCILPWTVRNIYTLLLSVFTL